ncbi:hypothetical protein J6590_037895 [Homalodisca vitripennis]|nr:hypothetical protein J6590_037895 [Homalodisca vitripennis]
MMSIVNSQRFRTMQSPTAAIPLDKSRPQTDCYTNRWRPTSTRPSELLVRNYRKVPKVPFSGHEAAVQLTLLLQSNWSGSPSGPHRGPTTPIN